MAATIATARGGDKSGRVKSTHRLGSEWSEAEVATWHTFATVKVTRDGRVQVRVKRDGVLIHEWEAGAE